MSAMTASVKCAPVTADLRDADEVCWQEAAVLRDQRRGRWVIIWSAQRREFQARPVFTVRELVFAAATIDSLTTEMDHFEQQYTRTLATRRAAARSR